MEILSNFISIYCFISFIIGAVYMLIIMSIVAMGKNKEPRNRAHFYVARDKDEELYFYPTKPIRRGDHFIPDHNKGITFTSTRFNRHYYCLSTKSFSSLKWEDEPVEVFLNMED